MARLNDSQPPGETIEALKKRYIRQNREIARANSAQSIRIRALENEASQLLEENIKLREQVIKLTVELDRRDRSHEILQNLSSTKTALEEKVKEILQLVGGLSAQVPAPPRDKLATGPKPVEERVWRNQYLASIEQEGLSPIKEDPVFPRKSSSIEDVPILPPAHRYDGPSPGSDKDDNENENENEKGGKDEDEDTYPDPPFSAYLDIRPRRRRDSTIAKSSLKSTTTTTITTTTFNLPIRSKLDSSPTKPTKRKFEDTTSPERRISFGEDEVSETFTFRVPEKSVGTVAIPTAGNEKTLKSGSDGAANEVLRRLNSETWSVLEGEEGNEKLCGGDKNASNESTGNGESKKEKVEPKREEEEESAKKEAAPAATDENKRGSKFTSIVLPDDCSALDMVPKPKKSNTSTAQRMALGPKTVNADLCPPQKQVLDTKPGDLLQKLKSLDVDFEKPSLISSVNKPLIENISLAPPPPPSNTSSSELLFSGRPSRRVSQSVNYALPNLRDKMRRETPEPVKKSRSGNSAARHRTRERERERGRESSESAVTASRASSVEPTDHDRNDLDSDDIHARKRQSSREQGRESSTNTSCSSSSSLYNPTRVADSFVTSCGTEGHKRLSFTSSLSQAMGTGDVYDYLISSSEKIVRDMGTSYRRNESGDDDSEEEEDGKRLATVSSRRKRVSFQGAVEERERGRSSFGGAGTVGIKESGRRRTIAVDLSDSGVRCETGY